MGVFMILFASGRTDIVAFYMDWFMNRLHEGFVDVRNPFNPKLVSRIYFSDVDALFFCTKNLIPILDYLAEIPFPILFHVTLTPYKRDIEPNVPDKGKIIEAIKKISAILGSEHLFVRYDPIFLSDRYNLEYHKKAFERLCTLLDGFVSHIIVSFLDNYKNVRKNKDILQFHDFTEQDYEILGLSFATIAKKHGISVQTCFEKQNLVSYGFVKEDCLSSTLAYELTGKTYKKWTARKENQCNCVQMVDIGVYNSCQHFCKYCYANYDEKKVCANKEQHNPKSSLLIGELHSDDVIKIRKK